MKEIKAYVRERMAGAVVEALVQAGFGAFSVLIVQGVEEGLASGSYEFSLELGDSYVKVAKLELVCHDASVDEAVMTIERAAHTGQRGDGVIFIAPIETAVRISDGARGEQCLRK